MIDPIDLISPAYDQQAGDVVVQIEVTSSSEPAGFEDSFRLWINDVEVTDFTATDLSPWTVDATVTLLGGQTVSIKFEATDNDETKSAVWTFNTYSEASFSDEQYRYAAFLNSFAEFYPEWTKARSNDYSIFRQFMNPIALEFDKVKLRLQNQNRSLNPSKNLWNDPDWLYQYPLDVGEEFVTKLDASGEEVAIPPTVWGIRGINRLPLTNRETFLDFWTNALPTRFSATAEGSPNTQLTASTPLGEVASLSDIEVPVPGFLYIWIHSVSNTVSIAEGLEVTDLVLKGYNPEGFWQVEHIPLVRNYTTPTQKPWGKISSVSVEGGPEEASAEVVIYNFPQRAISKEDTMFKASGGKTIQWALDSDDAGSVIDYQISGNGVLLDMARGEDTFYTERRYRLRDTSGSDVTITDFSIDPTSYYMYGISSSKLYIWDRREAWPENLVQLNGGSTNPEVDFHIMEYGDRVLGDGLGSYTTDLTIETDAPKGDATIKRWHWAVVDEVGVRTYIDPDNNLAVGGPYWRENQLPVQHFGIKEQPPTITITTVGALIFELTLEYFNGDTEVVKKVWVGRQMRAVAEYQISHIVDMSSNVPQVCALENGSIAVSDSGEFWTLTPQFDTFMTDFDGYRLLFREAYDSIEVSFDE